MGGQKTLRSYWRNYFEATDGLVWVVRAAPPLPKRPPTAPLPPLAIATPVPACDPAR